MKRLMTTAIAFPLALIAMAAAFSPKAETPDETGEMQIQFKGVSVGDSVLNAVVAMKNFTDTDYATITWSCEFHQAGYKVSVGLAVFRTVSNNTMVEDRFIFSSDDAHYNPEYISVRCKLADTEKRTQRNERRPCRNCTPFRVDVELNQHNGVFLRPDGVAKVAGTKKPPPQLVREGPEAPKNPLAEKL